MTLVWCGLKVKQLLYSSEDVKCMGIEVSGSLRVSFVKSIMAFNPLGLSIPIKQSKYWWNLKTWKFLVLRLDLKTSGQGILVPWAVEIGVEFQ